MFHLHVVRKTYENIELCEAVDVIFGKFGATVIEIGPRILDRSLSERMFFLFSHKRSGSFIFILIYI